MQIYNIITYIIIIIITNIITFIMVKNGHVIVHADMCATTVRYTYIYIKDDNLEDFVSHLNLK